MWWRICTIPSNRFQSILEHKDVPVQPSILVRTRIWDPSFQIHLLHFSKMFLTGNKEVHEPRVSPAFAITCFCNHCNISPTPMVVHQSMWKQWPFLPKVTDPWMTFDPKSVEVTCVTLPKNHCPSPMKIHQSMWIQWPSFQKLEPRSLIYWWPLTPHLLRSHVWIYPARIIVFKSHRNTSMYVDTVINFAKL